jgi:hypothetical protein
MASSARFWLSALVSSLLTAQSLGAARLAMIHIAVYLWTYTGAAVPKPLHELLASATERLASLPECTRAKGGDEGRGCPRAPQAAPVQHNPRLVFDALMWVYEIDQHLQRQVPRAQAGAHAGRCAAGGSATGMASPHAAPPFTSVLLNMWLILVTSPQVLQSPNCADPRDARLGVSACLRSLSLCMSAFGIACARDACERVLASCLDADLAHLECCGQAISVAMVASLHSGRIYHNQPGDLPAAPELPASTRERYGRLPAAWEGKAVYAHLALAGSACLLLSDVVSKLRSRGAAHLPLVFFRRMSQNMLSSLSQPSGSLGEALCGMRPHELAAPGLYPEATGWDAHRLPASLRDRRVEKSSELVLAQMEHFEALHQEFGGAFARAETVRAKDHIPLPSLDLAMLAGRVLAWCVSRQSSANAAVAMFIQPGWQVEGRRGPDQVHVSRLSPRAACDGNTASVYSLL